jgi:hypothetical protein
METEQLGGLLAEELRPGMVLGLIGPLGAGKTRLVGGNWSVSMAIGWRRISTPSTGPPSELLTWRPIAAGPLHGGPTGCAATGTAAAATIRRRTASPTTGL